MIKFSSGRLNSFLKWLRDKRVESYSNTIRYLTRALNKRSSINIESGTLVSIMGQDVVEEWFDDLSEALVWLSSLSIYCSENQQKEIINAFRVVGQAVSDLITSDSRPLHLQSVILSVLDSVIECAGRDRGENQTAVSFVGFCYRATQPTQTLILSFDAAFGYLLLTQLHR